MLTRDEVIWEFRYCLGRNPGGEDVIKAYRHHPDYRSLRDELLNNSEAIRDIVSTVHSTELHPAVHYDRRAVVFIHLQKCGGTTLHNALAAHFSPNRICPERFNNLHAYTAASLSDFDFFSGHFDYLSTTLIPRRRIFRLSILREPRARLISYYRFARAHPPNDALLRDPHFALAKSLGAEEYFENETIRSSPLVKDYYVAVFGGGLHATARTDGQYQVTRSSKLSHSLSAMKKLDALGVCEHMKKSIDAIFERLNLPAPDDVKREHATSLLEVLDEDAESAEEVPLTPRLNTALDGLVTGDEKLYRYAVDTLGVSSRNPLRADESASGPSIGAVSRNPLEADESASVPSSG